ncbi:hypothetical protein D3C72_2344090 [compost metagenome]
MLVGPVRVLVGPLLQDEDLAAQGQRVVQGMHAEVIETGPGPVQVQRHVRMRSFR